MKPAFAILSLAALTLQAQPPAAPAPNPIRENYSKFEYRIPARDGVKLFVSPDVAHTFRAGHRIMVQIQSSWFPLTDRNPQKFLDIPNASPADFVKATERVFTGGAEATRISLPILE